MISAQMMGHPERNNLNGNFSRSEGTGMEREKILLL
jgi:hypothetical protein